MNLTDHERERRAFWDAVHIAYMRQSSAGLQAAFADESLAERDKRFPTPSVPAPDQSAMGQAVAQTILAQTKDHAELQAAFDDLLVTSRSHIQDIYRLTKELETLRAKARYWDAVGCGNVGLQFNAADRVRANYVLDGVECWTDWHYARDVAVAVEAAIQAVATGS